MRKLTTTAALLAGLAALSACGGKGDDALGDNVNAAYENRADQLEQRADNLEDQADALRAEGERKEEAIDDADVDATRMNAADKAAVANAM